jgi:GTP-binding protein
MNINNAKFETTAVKPEQYPSSNIPEVAFVGRSNVGKSSIINTLLNRKGLARVGSTPGKTRVINFFNVDDKMYFVDLPGYGFANVSKKEISSWSRMIETYLNSREQLKLIIMIVDIRHLPTENDKIMHSWLEERSIPYMIAATKADKISKSQVNRNVNDIRKALKIDGQIPIIPASSSTKQGRDEIWKHIETNVHIPNNLTESQ